MLFVKSEIAYFSRCYVIFVTKKALNFSLARLSQSAFFRLRALTLKKHLTVHSKNIQLSRLFHL